MAVYFKIYKRLAHFDLNVEVRMENEFLVIEGPSGAGKTTILNCISGVMTPDRGEISIDERRLFYHNDTGSVSESAGRSSRKVNISTGKTNILTGRINIPAEKRSIGYLFQNYALFPHMTVRSNVLYGLKNQREYRRKETRRELLEYAEHMMSTMGIAHLAEKNAAAISGGEKQRTALARAMVTKPSLLLLDEPFSALDEGTKGLIYEEFAEFKDTFRIPTILITHDHRETELFADKKIILKEGRILKNERSSS